MGIPSKIINWLKGSGCEKLVKKTSNQIKISTGAEDVFNFEFSNEIKQLVQSTNLAVSLDDQQYLLCKSIEDEEDKEFAKDLKKIRLMSIMGITQLQSLLSSIDGDPSEDMKKELIKWNRFMNKLTKENIQMLKPGPRFIPKGKAKKTLEDIKKYQSIDDDELNGAIDLF